MKYFPVSRNLTAAVLVLFLAVASAPAALALPAGPAGDGGAVWNVEAFFDWVQGLFGGLIGGEGEEVGGPSQITDEMRGGLDPDGSDLTATSTPDSTEQSPSLEEGVVER